MGGLGAIVEATPLLARPALLGVDGVDGSGKTTYAGRLATAFREHGREAVVVHLDDFLNPRAVRYRKGRASPEGYFRDTYDLDAFTHNVLDPLAASGTCRVVRRAFDHRADRPVDDRPVEVPAAAVVIVEGMFLHRGGLRDHWDVSVFLDVPFAVSVARMAERDGTDPDPDSPAQRRYVEGQRLYLRTCDPAGRATFVVDNAQEPGGM